MRFGVLGSLLVCRDDGTPVAVPGAKVRQLLALLATHAGKPVGADRLIALLWPDERPGNPEAALQSKVSQVRRVLGDAESGARDLVRTRAGGYTLDAEPDAVDVSRFRTLVARAHTAAEPSRVVPLLTEALALWRGPALADHPGLEVADALDQQRLGAVEDLAEARLTLGEYGLVADELAARVAEHPLRERLHGLHLRALYGSGRQAEALDGYRRLRERLAAELGVDPSPPLARLHQAMLEQDPALDAPERVRPRTNLPTPVSPLVGRADAVREVRKLLGNGRLVTLTGPGGVGKSRLAVEVAPELAEDLPDGYWLVDLTGYGPEHSPCYLAEHVAGVLGVRDDLPHSGPPPADTPHRLADALRYQQLLLVVDDCEHVLGPIAELVALLLRECRALRVLATSRVPLGLGGEVLWPVPPLDLPASVRLFEERAAATFTVDESNAAAVETICRRLDGLPLALELAAARVRALGVAQVAARLDDRFALLATGHRDAPARQRTLRAVVDWSWQLLGDGERAVLRRLSVAADGFTLAAAEAVGAGGQVAEGDVLDLLARLVDHSLMVAEENTGTRYRLLETIAAYAAERLAEAGEVEQARERHTGYYLDLAGRAEAGLAGADQRRWLDELDAEAANLRAVLDRLAGDGRALRLAGALAWYWYLRGRHREGHSWLTTALAAGGERSPAAEAKALTWLAMFGSRERAGDPVRAGLRALDLYRGLGDPVAEANAKWLVAFAGRDGAGGAEVEPLADEAVTTLRGLPDRSGLACALLARGTIAMQHSRLAAARADGEEARAIFDELGDRWGQAGTANLLGVLAEIAGEHERAALLHRDGLRRAEEIGLWPAAVDQLSQLGRLATLAGDYAAADEYHDRANRLAWREGFHQGVVHSAAGLGISALRQGRLDEAESHLRIVLAEHLADGYDGGQAFARNHLGFVAAARGDANAARELHSDGLAAARRAADPRAVAQSLEGLAAVAVLDGDGAEAARLLGAAAAERESVGAPLPGAERAGVDSTEAAAKALVGAGFDAYFAEGHG